MTDGNYGARNGWIRLAALLVATLPACGGSVVADDMDGDAVVGEDSAGETGADGDGDEDAAGGDADADGDADEDGGPDAGSPPACTITAPLDGSSAPYDADRTFVASATDPEDGALSGASVVWTTDRDAVPLGTGLSVTVVLPASGSHRVTCTATDSDGNVGSGSITVVAQSPVVEIWHPGDGEVRVAGSSIPFVGNARDREDGALSGGALVWTSSIDGTIGTGGSFSAALSAGTNVITLTATDSVGNTGTETITLTMTP
ncbi:MAG: hypothetical protein HY907_21185 [Deltaproteobacteria bacterium]|nr:hypothetical protein [Deltaproteobacteria bacterium]